MTVDTLRSGPIADLIRRHRLLAVLRPSSADVGLLALVEQLADAGARVFEIRLETHTAETDLAAVRAHLQARTDGPFLVGAGSVLRRNELEAARRAGADFAVAPLLDPSLVATAVEEGMPFIPGAFTPDRDRDRVGGRRDVRQAVSRGIGRAGIRARAPWLDARRAAHPDRRHRRGQRRRVSRGRGGRGRDRHRARAGRCRDPARDRGVRRAARGPVLTDGGRFAGRNVLVTGSAVS